ncbi:MAG: CTP synthase [Berkelbacteria bacterium GW2011_GWA2_35_9]|uniref:CTP synthase n=1 Tax=Berkelbacteria bacterium GW2011_GWA2_35_9 TaxID=1618333 RepID=A0A0G0GAG3_9BACT|nr:MAG: CTP synthase [Berkelbacteria bacterium GW2011_GWA2_35_9]
MTKYIFVTGGVVSGIGKGITVASLGVLLKARGFKIGLLKLDPYLNIDAGTMNPFQHGEVFVTDDGAETDLDLGHYERFTDENLTKNSNSTTGQIYSAVLDKERTGEYLGATIQIIPHITNEIISRIKKVARKKDVVIVEIGGTVGDIESEPFIEAIRQFKRSVGRENICFVHTTKIDYIYPSEEPKTKPTQQSVSMLRSRGIQPDILVVRSKNGFSKSMKDKIALFCDVEESAIIPAPNAGSLYQIPLNLEKNNLAIKVLEKLNLKNRQPNLAQWENIKNQIENTKKEIRIGLVGKYTDNPDAYISVVESLKHTGISNLVDVKVIPIDSEKIDFVKLGKLSGIVVPGGFGIRGIEGKLKAIKFARENKTPFLGLCLGLQCAVIEFARNVCDLKKASSTEFNSQTPHPVIDILPEQIKVEKKGGSMRLGSYKALIKKGSIVAEIYQNQIVYERHRHRYEVNPKYHKILKEKGLILSGLSPNKKLVEFIELSQTVHPYFVATQAHPEFKSRPFRPAPLFDGLIKSALKKA